jgi:hypothetical protein
MKRSFNIVTNMWTPIKKYGGDYSWLIELCYNSTKPLTTKMTPLL